MTASDAKFLFCTKIDSAVKNNQGSADFWNDVSRDVFRDYRWNDDSLSVDDKEYVYGYIDASHGFLKKKRTLREMDIIKTALNYMVSNVDDVNECCICDEFDEDDINRLIGKLK